jgi:hypothetical protein
MISFLQRWFFGLATFKPDVPMMRECRNCEHLVRNRMANRLATHMIYDHKMSHDDAYQTVDWVFNRMKEHIKGQQ